MGGRHRETQQGEAGEVESRRESDAVCEEMKHRSGSPWALPLGLQQVVCEEALPVL